MTSKMSDLIELIKKELPRDIYLKIIGTLCCDIDMRIRLGLVNKLRIPKKLAERLNALTKPRKLPDNQTIFIELGCDGSITNNIVRHKVVQYYRDSRYCNGIQHWGVITHRKLETGQYVTDCMMSLSNDPCCFELLLSYNV